MRPQQVRSTPFWIAAGVIAALWLTTAGLAFWGISDRDKTTIAFPSNPWGFESFTGHTDVMAFFGSSVILLVLIPLLGIVSYITKGGPQGRFAYELAASVDTHE